MKNALLALAVLCAGATGRQSAAPPYDYEHAATEWIEESGLDAGHLTWDGLLEERFLSARIGGFDLRLPRAEVGDDEHAPRIVTVLSQAIEMQLAWGRWNQRGDGDLEKDAKRLTKWIERLDSRDLEKAAESESSDLFEAAGADDRVLEVARRLAHALTPRETAGDGEPVPTPTQVVIAPSRRVYVQLVAAAGFFHPAHRPRIWQDANLFTPNAWGVGFQIIPLLNPAHPMSRETVYEGWEVERYLTSSYEQHVAERLAASLLHSFFSFSTDPLLETALSTELVVATIGSTRIVNDFSSFSWSRKGASTKPYSRFVPGGASGGGVLPPRKAQAGAVQASSKSEVHVKELGNDYFVENLRERQADGRKVASREKELPREVRKNKVMHFVLRDGRDEHLMSAPFLGDAAEAKEIPPLRFLDDYEDFFTAYRSLFVHWLAEGADKDLRVHFPHFLEGVSVRTDSETVGAVAEQIYGTPMGWQGLDEPSLEADFLVWLSKQR